MKRATFGMAIAVPTQGTTKFLIDERVASLNENSAPPPSWRGRALYLGESGAENWIGVATELGYPLRPDKIETLRADRLDAIRLFRPASIVSLGPGDGLADRDLIRALQEESNGAWAEYISYYPVDVSQALLGTAVESVRLQARTPAGILCDFEDGQAFLKDTVADLVRHPIIYSMLGGTIGNLDGSEDKFFSGFRGILTDSDGFLMDVPLAGSNWSPGKEPRLHHASYSHAFRRFVLDGLRRIEGKSSELARTHKGVQREFEDRIDFQHRHDLRTGAEVITIVERDGAQPILILRRYRWERFIDWLEQHGFDVAFSKRSLRSEDDRFGMGVVLLRVEGSGTGELPNHHELF